MYLYDIVNQGIMIHIQGNDRSQIRMISLEEMVEPKSMVRIIDAFVDMLALDQFGFSYYQLNKEGRPPYHPATLMKLYIYGYQNSIRSCRKLEKACKTNIEVMWLLSDQRPHFKTIANFRKDNSKAFKAVFRFFVALLKDWNLIDGKTIAIDSFKTRAQNSLKNNFNSRKVKRHIDYIDQKIADYEKELDKEFDQLTQEKLSHNQQKKEAYQKIDQQLKDTGDVNDTKALAAMVNKAQENIGEVENVLADKGYHSGRELKACEELGVTTFISPKESSSSKKNPAFSMEAFSYDAENDTYTCPANEILTTNGRWYNKKLLNGRRSYRVKHYKTKACGACQLQSQCTKSVRGRYIERTEYQEYITRNNERVNQNPNYYRTRQQIIEHQFGTLKRHWHFDYLLTKGKTKVMGEVYIAFICYNLRRTVSVLSFNDLMDRIKRYKKLNKVLFWSILAPISTFIKQFKHVLSPIIQFGVKTIK